MKEHLSKDEATIRAIISKQSEAWTRGDAGEWAKPFAEDVDFVVRDGTHLKGQEEVARAHERFLEGSLPTGKMSGWTLRVNPRLCGDAQKR
jgi:uncharacterized protein (TIGR02246 family)